MSKVKISAVSRKTMPSKFGTTWEIIRVKIDGKGDEVFELEGFGKNEKEKVAAGTTLSGYFSERSWAGRNGPVVTKIFCKISAEYVYGLLVSKFPEIEGGPSGDNEPVATPSSSEWDVGEKSEGGFDGPGF